MNKAEHFKTLAAAMTALVVLAVAVMAQGAKSAKPSASTPDTAVTADVQDTAVTDTRDIWIAFLDEKTGFVGYKDKYGTVKIEPKFYSSGHTRTFDNIIALDDKQLGPYYLTKAGKTVGAGKTRGRDSVWFFDKSFDRESEGFIRFINRKTNKIGLFNRNGDVALHAEYDWLEKVKNGMAVASKRTSGKLKSALIDTLGNVLIENFGNWGDRELDFFSIEKTNTPNADETREYFSAKGGAYYSFVNFKKEFRQWLTRDLLLNLTAEKLIDAALDTVYWPTGKTEYRFGRSNARQFITGNFDFLKEQLSKALNPACADCLIDKSWWHYNCLIPPECCPDVFDRFCDCIGMVVALGSAEIDPPNQSYYCFSRVGGVYKLTFVNIKNGEVKY